MNNQDENDGHTFRITATFDDETTEQPTVRAYDYEVAALLGAMAWIKVAIEDGMDAPMKTEFVRVAGGCRVICTHDTHSVEILFRAEENTSVSPA
jgi:hypothetical protein